jgi:hypothetical protein
MRAHSSFSGLALLAFPALLAATARAQSFNLDVGDNLILSPTPSNAYGAAAGQTGYWNAVKTPYSVTLKDLTGTLTSVTTSSTDSSSFNMPVFAMNDDQNLMYDVQDVNQFSGVISWTISGLSNGSYRLYTYAWAPENTGALTLIDVPGSSDGPQTVGGMWTGSPHVHLITYALHHITISNGTITVNASGVNDSGSINGFQIVQDTSSFAAICPGDSTAFPPCPCGNTGMPNHGCDNSAATGGALLTASGNTSPDTVVLTSSFELPSVPSIFLQGHVNQFPGAVFGDGVRCVNGTLKRLYQHNATAGVVSAPTGTDLSITARSAALGDPINPGDTRYYQVYYRDPNLSFCPAPTGNSWNVSSGIAISW